MADEGFLSRWARRKSALAHGETVEPEPAPDGALQETAPASAHAPASASEPESAAPPAARLLPSMDDVARLTQDADFSVFVARDVDPAVRRGALKKLFADPHFHVMDGLDVYIDDYTKPSPMSEAMLAALTHAKRVLQPLLPDEAPAPATEAGDAVATLQAAQVPESIEPTPLPDPPPDHPTTPEQETQ